MSVFFCFFFKRHCSMLAWFGDDMLVSSFDVYMVGEYVLA